MLEAISAYSSKRAKDLVTAGMTRRQVRDLAHQNLQEGIGIRTEAGRIGKFLKEEALKTQRAVNRGVDKVEGLVSPIESEWRALRDKCDAEEQAEKDAERQRAEALISARVQRLASVGVSVQVTPYKGSMWANLTVGNGGLTLQHLQVYQEAALATMSDSAFEAAFLETKAAYDQIQAAAAAQAAELARLQRDERIRTRTTALLAAEFEVKAEDNIGDITEEDYQRLLRNAQKVITDRQDEQRKALEERERKQREAEEKLAQERQALRDAILDQRTRALSAIGAPTPADVADWTQDAFDTYLAGKRGEAEERRRALAERDEAARLERERLAKEEEDRLAEEKRVAAEAEAQREADRLAAIEALKPDLQRLTEYAASLRAVPAPAMSTDEGKSRLTEIQMRLGMILEASVPGLPDAA